MPHDAALHSSHPALTDIALGLGSTHDILPPTFQDPARANTELETLKRRITDAGGYLGAIWALGLEADDAAAEGIRPVEAEAYIAVPEHLIPTGVDQDEEQLPSSQHPSFPYGNPYAPITGHGPATTLVATSESRASAPKLDPRMHMHLAVAYHSSILGGAQRETSTSSPSTSNTERFEAVLQRGPIKPQSLGSNGTTLAPHLVLRSRAETASNPPIWPFRRFGPGKGGNESLRRSEASRPWRPTREVWADFALEQLQPLGGERDPLVSFREDVEGKRKLMERAFGEEREREKEKRLEKERLRRREERKRAAAAAAAANVTADESGMNGAEQTYADDSQVGEQTGGESSLDESAMRAVALVDSEGEEGEEETDAFEHTGGYVDDYSITGGGGQAGADASSASAAAAATRGGRSDVEFCLADWDPDDDLEDGQGEAVGRGLGDGAMGGGGGGQGFVWGRGRTAAGVRDRPATPYSEL